MTARTLKEVAQAGLVLGFEWIAKDGTTGAVNVFSWMPTWDNLTGSWLYGGSRKPLGVTDFPDLPPEKSLLKLRDIVEGDDDR